MTDEGFLGKFHCNCVIKSLYFDTLMIYLYWSFNILYSLLSVLLFLSCVEKSNIISWRIIKIVKIAFLPVNVWLGSQTKSAGCSCLGATQSFPGRWITLRKYCFKIGESLLSWKGELCTCSGDVFQFQSISTQGKNPISVTSSSQ